jgi:hypothetical protein
MEVSLESVHTFDFPLSRNLGEREWDVFLSYPSQTTEKAKEGGCVVFEATI